MTQILMLLQAHNYLALAVLAVGYAMRILAPDSKFPVTIPTRWVPAATLLLGQIYGVLTAVQLGQAWLPAVESGLTASFIVVIVQALFAGKEPKWFQVIAFVLSDAGTDPTPPTAGTTFSKESPTNPAKKISSPPASKFRILWGLPVVFAVLSCKQAQAIFTDVQVACQAEALATSIIPPGTPVAQVAQDVELACDLTEAVDADVQAVVAAYEAAQAEAGVSATTYIPTPMATKKRALKAGITITEAGAPASPAAQTTASPVVSAAPSAAPAPTPKAGDAGASSKTDAAAKK